MKKDFNSLILSLMFAFFNAALFGQNVGIGTNSPAGKLHIKGSADIPQLIIDANSTQSVTNSPLIKLRSSDGVTDLLWINSDNPTNVFLGAGAGRQNVIGDGAIANTFIGGDAGINNLTGYQNTGVGYQSLYSNNTGNNNTGFGVQALYHSITGNNNTALGQGAMTFNYAGNNGTAIGYGAMYYANNSLTSFTNSNVAVGYEALRGSTSPSNNTGLGNTALGYQSNWAITSGLGNTGSGWQTLYLNTTGSENTAHGFAALQNITNASGNTALGFCALINNKAGSNATAIGDGAMYYANNTSNGFINYNVAVGYQALRGSTNAAANTGNYNTASGYESLWSNTTGNYNSANGYYSLYSNSIGFGNTGYGYQSVYSNTTGNYNSSLGMNAYFPSAALSNTSCIGYNSGGMVNANNRIELGNTSVSVIAGQVGFSTYSDARIKDNIKEDVPGLAFIGRLKPVTYNLNIHRENAMMRKNTGEEEKNWDGKYDIENIKMSGFLAQDVEQAAHEAGYDFSGVQKPANPDELYSLRYSDFVMPLVKAVQELSAKNDAQDKIIDDLTQRIEKLETLMAKKDE